MSLFKGISQLRPEHQGPLILMFRVRSNQSDQPPNPKLTRLVWIRSDQPRSEDTSPSLSTLVRGTVWKPSWRRSSSLHSKEADANQVWLFSYSCQNNPRPVRTHLRINSPESRPQSRNWGGNLVYLNFSLFLGTFDSLSDGSPFPPVGNFLEPLKVETLREYQNSSQSCVSIGGYYFMDSF